MTPGDKNGAEKRNGLEKMTSVEDSIQKLTNKVLPGIFSSSSKVSTMVQDNSSEKHSKSESCDEVDDHENRKEIKRRRIIVCAVLLLCMAGALQGILVNGLINVVISTIEKR